MAGDAADPVPVPGHESLRVAGEPLQVESAPRGSPRLARVGADEAALVVVDGASVLWSQRITGAFSAWPLDVGAPVQHRREDRRGLGLGAVVGFDDGSFTAENGPGVAWVHAAVGVPGVRDSLDWRAYAERTPSGGVFILKWEPPRWQLSHRATRDPRAPGLDLGRLPKDEHVVAGTTTYGGRLILATHDHDAQVTTIRVASKRKVRVSATLPVTAASARAIPRPGGGAFFVVHGSKLRGLWVHAVDEDGAVIGEPWLCRTVSPDDHWMAIEPWRDGFVLATSRGDEGFGLVVSDGAHATYGATASPRSQRAGIASSPDGSVILFAYETPTGVEIARLACGPSDGAPIFVPARGPAWAAPPPPTSEPCPFGTRDDVVRRVRQRRILVALCPLSGSDFQGSTSGDAKAGHYESHDGCGDSFVVHWDETGVVALAWDHEVGTVEKPRHQRNPGRYLRKVPASMRALAERATEYGERLATEGLWIEAGAAPTYGQSESIKEILNELRAEDTEGVWLAGGDVVGELAGRMASSDTYEVTADDERQLLALTADRLMPLRAAHVAKVAQALAELGVVWRDAVLHAAPAIDATKGEREARMSAPDRALLHAARAGDLDGVKRALAAGANIDAPAPAGELQWTSEGETPLIVALRARHAAVADHLIEAGADIRASCGAHGGSMTPLRIAAGQGNVELTGRLLALGATHGGESRSAFSQLLSDADRGKVASADYAAIIRLLLEAGAPLTDDVQRIQLAWIAEQGGALDLVPRLSPVYEPDALPDVPALADPAASCERVSAAIERAAAAITKNTAVALDALIEAWRASRHPRVGDAAERLAVRVRGANLEYLSGKSRGPVDGEDSVSALQAACAAEPDPRATRAVLGGLMTTDMQWTKARVARCEDAAAALLVHVRDGRYAESLEQHCGGLRRSWFPVRASLRVALRAMQEVRPGALSEADIRHLGFIEDTLAQRKPMAAGATGPTTHDLFAAVYECPDDDAPRRALADRLVEAGDPRGEFIALQLDRVAKNGKVTKREKDLLKEHGRRWLGELALILGDDLVFERGFLAQAATGDGRDPSAVRVSGYPLLVSGGGTQLEWSTVRRLSLWRHAFHGTFVLLRGSRIRGVRELCDVGENDLPSLVHGPPRALERLEIAGAHRLNDRATEVIRALEGQLAASLPALTHLRMGAPGGVLDGVRRVVEGMSKLHELSVGLEAPKIAELAAFAKEHRLAKLRSLGPVELAFTLETGVLDISFPLMLETKLAISAARSLAEAADVPIRSVVVRKPARTEIEARSGAPPLLRRRKEAMDLRPIYDAAAARGASCAIDDDEPAWAKRVG